MPAITLKRERVFEVLGAWLGVAVFCWSCFRCFLLVTIFQPFFSSESESEFMIGRFLESMGGGRDKFREGEAMVASKRGRER